MATLNNLPNNSIGSLPYSDRQLIIVTQDDAANAMRDAEQKVAVREHGLNWSKIAGAALSAIIFPMGTLIAEVTKEAIGAWERARTSGIQILPIGKSEAVDIHFPPGHPREGVLYIGHPANPTVYYTTAEFHRVTFEHKFAEAINLLMSLGATKIRVEHLRGWSKDFSSNLSVPLGDVSSTLNAEAGANSKSSTQILYEASLGGCSEPCLPDDLVWFPHESTWQSIANGRIKYGLQNFSLTVSYEDDFGVNAGLKTSILKSGLELGGKFEDHVSTIWRIQGEFKSL